MIMPQPLVSILMPVKNTEKFLEECLRSITEQSLKNWELIAIDDHSSDDSLKILKKFSAKDSRIKVFRNNRQGIIPALRLAYKKSSGRWITRMDSDDVMPPDKLEELCANLKKKGRGFVSTGLVRYFDNPNLSDGYKKYEQWINEISREQRNLDEIYRECVFASPCWMIHREDFDRCGAFDSDIYPEDYDLCFRFYQAGMKSVASEKLLHLWRDYPNRTSKTDPHYMDHQYYDIKLHYFLKLECNDDTTTVLWSAGKKSKILAKKLIDGNSDFTWVCTNEKKIGNRIADKIIQDYQTVPKIKNPRIIIPIVSPKYQQMVAEYLESFGLKKNHHFFIFG